MNRSKTLSIVFLLASITPLTAGELSTPKELAEQILSTTGVQGGLVVHWGCGDGSLTAALRANDSYLVQGLTADPAQVQKARDFLQSKGLYGPVTVESCTGNRLPYANHTVNLLVAGNPAGLPLPEVSRVLAPGGVAYLGDSSGKWTKTIQPWPREMDEWTHWFHGPDGNNVSRDLLVGPPRRLQWTTGPFWARHHALPNTVSVVVSAGGRLYYVLDESPNSILGGVPDTWALVACDAFNGVELWRRPMGPWGRAAWGGDFYKDPDKQLLHFWKVPADAQRRVVADGDRLFLPLGYRAPITVLDGATGKTLHTFKGSESCQLVICADQQVFLAGGGGKDQPELAVYDAQSFEPVWHKSKQEFTGIVDLAVRNGQAVVLERTAVVAYEAATGKKLWRGKDVGDTERAKFNRLVLTDPATLVLDDKDILRAYSPQDGALLWSYALQRMVHRNLDEPKGSRIELYVVDDTVWASSGLTTLAGLNLKTGAVEKSLDATAVLTSPHHHRCYSNRATARFMILGKENVEFVGFDEQVMLVQNWIRGTCRFGVLPANGMLYVPPSACTCYMNIMLRGFNALAAGHDVLPQNSEPLLVRGPAYGQVVVNAANAPGDWPTYRHDGARRGATSQPVSGPLTKTWQVALGSRLSPPVAAQGRVLVADIERHLVHCLYAADGRTVWTFTAGGRVDTPPTVEGGCVLFGSRDGWVYCLRLSDGALVWRLQAAPAERQIVAHGQLESTWPVHGNVLLNKGVAYVTAGRDTRLDGGIRVLALDPPSGRVLHQAVFDTPERTAPLKDNRDPTERTGFVSDLLVADGNDFWMRTVKFTPQLLADPSEFKGGTGGGGMSPTGGVTALPHLTAVSGFLDDQYFDRVYWGYKGVFGQMLAVDSRMVYGIRAFDHTGFGLSYKPGSGYILFGETHAGQKPKNPPAVKFKDPGEATSQPDPQTPSAYQELARPHPLPSNLWSRRCDLRVRALVLADQTLVLAGVPDKVDPKDPYATFLGRGPATLRLVSTSKGETLAELDLDSPPAWDGMAVTAGKIYIAGTDGKLTCYAEK